MPVSRSSVPVGTTLDSDEFNPNYPMHPDRRAIWAKAHGYKLTQKHSVCLYALAGQKHHDVCFCVCAGGLIDHAETWMRAGQLAAITAQPYSSGLSPAALDRLRAQCQRLGLCMSTFENGNWYNDPGGVLLILIERAEQNSEAR